MVGYLPIPTGVPWWDTSLYPRVYIGCTMVVYTLPPTYPRVYYGGYTPSLLWYTLYTLGIPTTLPLHGVPQFMPELTSVSGREGPGL